MFVKLTRHVPKSHLLVPVFVRADTITSFTPKIKRNPDLGGPQLDEGTMVHTYIRTGDQSWPGTESWWVTETPEEIQEKLEELSARMDASHG